MRLQYQRGAAASPHSSTYREISFDIETPVIPGNFRAAPLSLDIGRARSVVVKSRGHFRGGFDEFFGPEQIVEVDLPGLTSPMLNRFTWTRLPRPVIPLDEGVDWQPPP